MDAVASAAAESVSSEQKQFKSAALERARAILQRAVVPDERDALSQTWVLVDEIGMKEINGGGFEPAVTHLIEEHKMQGNSKLLLVVQSDFLEPVIEHFNIDYFHLVGTGTLKEQL